MAILDPDGKLAAIYTDSIIVIGPARYMPPAGERLEGTSIVLLGDAEEKAILADWLRSQDLGTAAKALGCSVSTVQRLRDALHITTPYTGTSRTTKWRHTRTTREDSER